MTAREAIEGGEHTLGGFLRVMEIDAVEAPAHANAFDRIRAGELQAVVVRDVYPPEVLAPLVRRLEANEPAFLQTWFPQKFRSWFFGRNLNLADPGLAGYFDEAARFAPALEYLFAPDENIEVRVGRVLAALDHGRPFVAPPGPGAGQRYMFTTLRAHEEGGYIPPHFDNEQALRPSYAHLRTLVELHMTSFVLTLDRHGEGGALEVFDCRCNPEGAVPLARDGAARPVIEGLRSVAFRIPPGAMIVLDSGRYLHRLTPIEGERKRWTACSFMALSRRGDAMYCWG
ncbi:MAG: 2OG-Fe(II) oxygenase [Betaproteobacteria bacterium]